MVKTRAGEKEMLRHQIIENAARVIRLRGIDGAGIAEIMAAGGLTTGALYSHFKSKDDLFVEVVAFEVQRTLGFLARALADHPERGVAFWIEQYLSTNQLKYGEACGMAAFSSDIARTSPKVRRRFEVTFCDLQHQLASKLPPAVENRVAIASALLAIMFGALNLAKSMSSKKCASSLLDDARGIAIHILKSASHSAR